MLSIDCNGNIKVNKCDTFNVPLFINIGKDIFNDLRFEIQENDTVVFLLTEANLPLCKAILKKQYDIKNVNENNDVIISFDSDDTKCLNPGIYYYEIKLIRKTDGKDIIVTVVPRRKFVIL